MSLPGGQGAGKEFIKYIILVDLVLLSCACLVRRSGRVSCSFSLSGGRVLLRGSVIQWVEWMGWSVVIGSCSG
jgi:hypothetical protein